MERRSPAAEPLLPRSREPPMLAVRLLGLFICLSLPACSHPPAASARSSSDSVTLTIGLPFMSGRDSLNGIQQAVRLLSFEGLAQIEPEGRPQPRLAQGWTVSPDGLSWTFQLRDNAFFHDGSPVDSTAVKASLERTLSSPAVAMSPGLVDIIGIDTPKPYQLVIKLRRRSTFLLDDLVVSISKPSPDGPPVGTGPYVTDSTTPTEVTMKAFPSYYRGVPSADRIVWKSYPTARASWASMMRGEIDVLFEVPPDAFEFMSSEDSVEKFSFLRNYVHGVVFNMHRPIFRDSRVRRALNHAVNRVALINQAFDGHGVPANTPTWPDHWASDRNLPNYTYDPARATALMEEAGLKIDDDRPPARMRFKCIFPTNPVWERMALMVQRDFSQIGVDVQFEELPLAEFNRRRVNGDFDAVLSELIAGNSAGRPYVFWHSSSKQNSVGYQNPQVDNAFDRLRQATDDAQTRAAFRDLQLQMLDDPPGVFLAFGQLTRAVSRRFTVTVVPGNDIIRSINEWHLAVQGAERDSN